MDTGAHDRRELQLHVQVMEVQCAELAGHLLPLLLAEAQLLLGDGGLVELAVIQLGRADGEQLLCLLDGLLNVLHHGLARPGLNLGQEQKHEQALDER